MIKLIKELKDEAATHAFAAALAKRLKKGDCIALSGDLGTGKTSFARGVLRAMGVKDDVTSPTFTLMQSYEVGKEIVWHCDFYRLEKPGEAVALGLEDLWDRHVMLIEWPERIAPLLPAARLNIVIEYGKTADARRLILSGESDWQERLAGL